jgi:Kef-type K+ transport system membrane component KefB
MSPLQLTIQFLFQIALILLFCRAVGRLAVRFGQPQVVAEMIAGVFLGPSVFGLLAPEWHARVFPAESLRVLFPISQLGLALYMFIVGLEFRVDLVRARYRASAAVSLAGMAAPFLLGGALGYFLHGTEALFPAQTSRLEASLFLGAALCITAFPMLARIIHFKGLAGTTMGTVALGAGALDDAMAWCLLAVVLASFSGDWSLAATTVLGGLGYVAVVLVILRPLLARWARALTEGREEVADDHLVLALALAAGGAWFTDLIGLHAVFGAFIMGAALPRGRFAEAVVSRMQPVVVCLLLPLFFTYSGLNTQMNLLGSAGLWGATLLVFAAAVIGKGVACAAAARWSGLPARESLGIGALMNARGLMELIIINIGLQAGVIGPALFAILVIMAVGTTLMASPIFDRLAPGLETEGRQPGKAIQGVP